MSVKVVIGANYGDEGKGLMTDYFASISQEEKKSCIVVCTNGGSQRGHTVVTEDNQRHVFSHFGSGTFRDAATYFSRYYILNPMNFAVEYKELNKYGLNPQTFFNKGCLWSTPYDMIANQIIEEYRGENKHGSCGIGIWETILRAESMNSIDILDFYNLSQNEKVEYLEDVKKYIQKRVFKATGSSMNKQWCEVFESKALIENYIVDLNFFVEHSKVATDNIVQNFADIIFENGQGLLLDQNQTEKKHTTPSNTGMENVLEILNLLDVMDKIEVCYVTRTYLTRHGAGPFDTECDETEIGEDIFDATNVTNPHQGKLRYGRININELANRIFSDYKKGNNTKVSLAVTHADETNGNFIFTEEINVSELYEQFDNVYISKGASKSCVQKYK